ncbi:MAG TPA: hypothetical protein PLG90_05825 [Ignavibacteria bacterium]|nr:hypothetical protein [Ignavibacteria bacterium]
MENEQKELLTKLANKLKSQKRTKKEALKTLQSAKILDKKGNLTNHYKNLRKVLIKSD